MDAPLVLSSRIDPEEIDDESHNLDIFERFPVEFYEKTYEPLKPAEVLEYIDNVEMHLGTPAAIRRIDVFPTIHQVSMLDLQYVFIKDFLQ